MHWFNIVDFSLLSAIVFIQAVALVFLVKSRRKRGNRNQRTIITALCVCELVGALFTITSYLFEFYVLLLATDIIFCFENIFTMLNYYFIMALLTIDRLLVFYLNIRYASRFNFKKLLKLIFSVVTISFVTTITILILIALRERTWQQFESVIYIMFLSFDIGYIILAIVTYTYIFIVYRRHLKLKKDTQGGNNKEHFKLLVPSLIIGTFVIFFILPDFLNVTYRYNLIIYSNDLVTYVATILYRIGWIVDPLIYIFYSNCKRKRKQHEETEVTRTTTNVREEEM